MRASIHNSLVRLAVPVTALALLAGPASAQEVTENSGDLFLSMVTAVGLGDLKTQVAAAVGAVLLISMVFVARKYFGRAIGAPTK